MVPQLAEEKGRARQPSWRGLYGDFDGLSGSCHKRDSEDVDEESGAAKLKYCSPKKPSSVRALQSKSRHQSHVIWSSRPGILSMTTR